ncbi:MAG: DUF11 domain-containing protein [Spirosomataceae bacterium]
MKKLLHLSSLVLLLLLKMGIQGYAQKGSFAVQLVLKNTDCINNKAVIQVQVRANHADSTFNLGDANFRFLYSSLALSNPIISANPSALGSTTGYSVNLQGSTQGATNGLVSLNLLYAGQSPPTLITTTWTTVADIQFDLVSPLATNCVDLTWQTNRTPPITGMNEVIVTGQSPLTFTTASVKASGVFIKLNLCPSQICQNPSPSTASYGVQLVSKSFDCVTKKAVVLVKVRAKDANSTFLMGDANFRFNYNTTLLANPKIVQQVNFASGSYTSQDLQGSSVNGSAGLVSLNVKYAPGSTPTAQQVGVDWMSVACIEFDYVGSTTAACFDLAWQTATDIPKTGMNEVKITGNTYTLTPVASANVFEKLTLCPTQLCPARTVSLSITKTRLGPAQVNLNDNVSFKLVIKNAGPDTAVNVVVVDSLPASMQWVSATPTVTPLTGNVGTWTIAKIAPQDSAIVIQIVNGSAGLVSLNVKYAPGSTPTAQQVGVDWISVACIEFDYVGSNSAACFDLSWQTGSTTFLNRMNEVKITDNTYTLTPVASANVFEKLTLYPPSFAQLARYHFQ